MDRHRVQTFSENVCWAVLRWPSSSSFSMVRFEQLAAQLNAEMPTRLRGTGCSVVAYCRLARRDACRASLGDLWSPTEYPKTKSDPIVFSFSIFSRPFLVGFSFSQTRFLPGWSERLTYKLLILSFSCCWKEPRSVSISTVFSLFRRSLCFSFSIYA